MLKPIGMFAAAGFLGAVLVKLLWMLMLPLFGVFVGLVALGFKILLIVGLVMLGMWIFKRLADRPSEA